MYNLDEDLIEKVSKCKICLYRLWEPKDTVVVLGRSGKKKEAVYMGRCQHDNIPILKRLGGGEAVVLTKGVLVISIAKKVNNYFKILKYFNSINSFIIHRLEELGIENLAQRGISDICIRDRKILGSSLYRNRELLFYQASLLVKANLDIINRYLKRPVREPEYRKGRKHKDFLTTLYKEDYRFGMDILKNHLKRVLNNDLRKID